MEDTKQRQDAPLRDSPIDVEGAVRQRYSEASKRAEASLCCPVEYNASFLEVLPDELIQRDYGCGDPSRYVMPGETVLDLGSGGGKICYIASQVVGPQGCVIGVDMNDDMLALARRYRQEIGDRIGFHNVEFHKGRIQDLGLDLDRWESYLSENPVRSAEDWVKAQAEAERIGREQPMIPTESVDVIVSNCVLNLVSPAARKQLFCEMHRVLRRGGRAVISDIVSDEPVPDTIRNDPDMWSGCIGGSFVEHEFLAAFEQAGFYGMEIVAWQDSPWATVQGIEFRSVTVQAYKGKEGPCLDRHQAVIYRGPWERVQDDNGHTLRRGVRTAVCDKTFQIYTQEPFCDHVTPVPPRQEVGSKDARDFDCQRDEIRPPRTTKGSSFVETILPVSDSCCGDDCC